MTTTLTWPRLALSLAFPDLETGYPGYGRPRKSGEFPFSFPRVQTLGEVFAWRQTAIRTPRPLLLDLYCGAGGAAMGYARAGFDVIGVDVVPQPNYPFPFIQADALSFIDQNWWLLRPDYRGSRATCFDAIHASPPCQRYSAMSNCRKGLADSYPDLVAPTRSLLDEYTRVPWVIENVPGSPLRDPIVLCGTQFGRDLYRHRLFESPAPLQALGHLPHTKPASRAGHWVPGTVISVSGHCAPMAEARKQMGDVGWMNRAELAESVPWYYTEYIGKQLLELKDTEWLRYAGIRETSGHYEDEQVG